MSDPKKKKSANPGPSSRFHIPPNLSSIPEIHAVTVDNTCTTPPHAVSRKHVISQAEAETFRVHPKLEPRRSKDSSMTFQPVETPDPRAPIKKQHSKDSPMAFDNDTSPEANALKPSSLELSCVLQ